MKTVLKTKDIILMLADDIEMQEDTLNSLLELHLSINAGTRVFRSVGYVKRKV